MRTSSSLAIAAAISLASLSTTVHARSDAQRVDLGRRHADANVGGDKMVKRRLVKRGELPLPGSALMLTVPNVTVPAEVNATVATVNETIADASNSTAVPVPTYNGTALWFFETGDKSACYTVHTDEDLVVGLPTQWWNNTGVVSPLCGQYMYLTNPATGANVTALISDASGKEYVTLTKAAFRALAPLQVGMIDVVYSFLNATTNATSTPVIKGAAAAVSSGPIVAVVSSSATVSAAPTETTSTAPKTTVAATTTAAPTTTKAATTTTTTFFDSASYSRSKASAEAAAAAASSSSSSAAAAKAEAQWEAQQASSSSAAAAAAASSKAAAAAASSKAAEQAAAASSSAAAAAAASASAKAKAQAQADQQAQLQAQQAQQSQQNSGGGGGKTYTGGWATFFYQNGVAGACGKVNPDSAKVIAIDSAMYDNGANCGRSITLTRTDNGASVTATVADECPTCASGTSLDLSVGAFNVIATVAEGMVPITWHFND